MKQSQAGFMIMGIVLGIFLVSLVVGPLWYHYHTQNLKTIEADKITMSVKETARESLYKIIREIGKAVPGQVRVSPDGESLILQVDNSAESLEIRYELGGLGREELIRTNVSTGESKVMVHAVDRLSFIINGQDPAYVTINMLLQPTMPDGKTISTKPFKLMGQAEIPTL